MTFLASFSFGQKISIIRTEFEAEKITIYYDLEGEAEGQLFDVSLWSSVNNFSNPLIFVQGEAGKDIKVGKGKKIIWNAGKELMVYRGSVTFEIKALLTHSPLSLNRPVSGQSLRRGNTYPIAWTGGTGGSPKIELLRGSDQVMNIQETEIKNTADLVLPMKIKPGSYAIKLTASNGTVSTNIKIKRKIPLSLKIAPIILLGGVTILILSNGKDSKDQNDDLPSPPADPL